MESQRGQNNLTQGGMTRNLLLFAVPFLLANFLQAAYGAVDLWVVGKFGGGQAGVSAVASGGEVMHLVMAFIMGLTTGATVLIGQFFGAGDKRNTSRSIGMTLSVSALLGVVMTAFLLVLSPYLVAALQTPREAVEATHDYLSICSWGVIFIVGYNALSAIFRGFGNSNAPLVFVGIACVCNVIGDLILVAWLKLGVRGAAWATVTSQALSMIFAAWYFWKGGFGFKFKLPNFRIVWSLAWQYIRIGVPIAVQGILINLSFLFIVSIVNTMGVAASAGYGIVNRINGFAMLPAGSFAMAMAAITAQNIGAGKPVRAVRTLWLAVAYTLACGSVFFVLFQTIPDDLVALFIARDSDGATEVIRQGVLYARSFSWEYILVPIVFCTNGFFNGCGRAFFSMANNLCSTFLIRVPVSYFFSVMAGATLFHVGFAAPMASFTSNIVALIFLLSGKWRLPRAAKTAEKA